MVETLVNCIFIGAFLGAVFGIPQIIVALKEQEK